MNGASKILTVSYGTFSCTLEGFDDPFNTMKAIAEYFRDLAAEDRYFGAEPPTPDAAMLHRIAEREIQRRVEAKIQENGVVLRASGDEAAAPAVAVAAPAPSVAPAVSEAAAPALAPVVAPSVAPADATATESVVAKLSRLRSEVAAQPGTVAPVTTMPTVSFAIPDYLEDEHAEVIEASPMPVDLVADALPEDAAALSDAPEDAALPEAEPATDDDALLATIAAAPEAEAVIEEPVTEEPVTTDGTADDVVEQAALPEVDLPESLMAALADSTVGALDGDILDAAEAVAPVDAEPSAAADEGTIDGLSDLIADAELVEVAVEAETSFDALDQTDAEDVAQDPAADQDLAEAEPPEDADGYDAQEEAVEAAFARVDDAPSVETEDAREAQEEAVEAAFAQDGDEAAPAATGDDVSTAPDLRPGAAEKLQRARARVIRIRRNDDTSTEAAPEAAPEAAADTVAAAPTPAPVAPVRPRRVTAPAAQPAPVPSVDEAPAAPAATASTAPSDDDFEANLSSIFAEVEEEEAAPPAAKPEAVAPASAPAAQATEEAVEGLLSAEDEAELMRELAALRTNEEDGDSAAAGASAFVLQQESRKGFSGPSADEALGRLMKQTDTEMEGPENKRRQSAIAHLKAAVAATVADRKVTGDKPADTAGVSRLARYRNDLAMVVKSALPGRGGSEAPKERPAPLVLVSEQRIDRPRPDPMAAPAAAPAAVQPVQPVRPRRVSASGSGLAMQAEAYDEDDAEEDVGNVFGDTQGFEEFVDRVGAVTLEEILEASAAYLAGVEGLDSFSRPQVMHHVGAVVPPGTFQREDGLRGFGTLLRSGRITKLRRGQFVLAEDSPYLAEAKKIAG